MRPSTGRRNSGFTLLEVVLAVAITGLVMAGVYAVARAAVSMSDEIVESQEQAMTTQSFVDLLRRNFEQMPGNGQVQLVVTDAGPGGATLTDVVLGEYPLAFSWAGVEAGAQTVILRTERDPRGALQARVLYLTEEQAQDYENNQLREEMVASIVLLDGIRYMQWHFWDDRMEEWTDSWLRQKYGTRRPSLVNLYLQFFDGGPGQNIVFWIPTVAPPETFAGGAGGPGGGPQNPGGDPNAPPPPNPGGPGAPGGGGPSVSIPTPPGR